MENNVWPYHAIVDIQRGRDTGEEKCSYHIKVINKC